MLLKLETEHSEDGGHSGKKGSKADKNKFRLSKSMMRRKVTVNPQDNPIIQTIYRTLKTNKQQLKKEHFYAMKSENIYKQMDLIICEKVYTDIELSRGPVDQRLPDPFPNFMYDQVLVQYGLYSVSIKVLMQLVNGL